MRHLLRVWPLVAIGLLVPAARAADDPPPVDEDTAGAEQNTPLDPAVKLRLQDEFAGTHEDYLTLSEAERGDLDFAGYARAEFEYYRNWGLGIILGLAPAVFAASLGVGLGYCDDGTDGERCRAVSMASGVPVVVLTTIVGGTFLTTYSGKLARMDRILSGESRAATDKPAPGALQLAPLLDQRGRPGGVAVGFRF